MGQKQADMGQIWDKNRRIWDKLRNLAKIVDSGCPSEVVVRMVASCLAISGRGVCRTQ